MRTEHELVAGLIAVHDIAVDDAVRAHVEQTLRSTEVLPIRPTPGEPFDPTLHEVVGVQSAPDPTVAGRIARLVRPGWSHHDRLLRPAQVMVHRGR